MTTSLAAALGLALRDACRVACRDACRVACRIALRIVVPLALAGAADLASAGTVTYTPSGDLVPAPERGFYRHTERHSNDASPLDPALLASYRAAGSTLILRVFYLESFVDAPISGPYLALVESDLAAVRQAGLKAVLRFAYTSVLPPAPPYGDATKARVLGHIGQLEPVLRANADVIALVQAGFIGTWGEWYYTDAFVADPSVPWNITPQDYANRREVVERLLAALPSARPTQLRTPYYKKNVFGVGAPLGEGEAFTPEPRARTGHHNDCFLASATDFGTYLDPATEYPYLAEETKWTPMGGETCAPNPPRSDCPTAQSEMALFHWSFLNRDWNPDVIASWAAQGCLPTIERRLGYRLALVSGTFDDAVRPGDALHAQLVLRNEGWAAPFLARDAQFVLRRTGTGETYTATVAADPRRWQPSSSATYTVDLAACTPSALPAGTYELLLALPDRARRLRPRAGYALPMANDGGVREAATGYNNLGVTITVSSSAPASPCTTSRRFVSASGVVGEVVGLHWSDSTNLHWTTDPAASRYHVYRDELPRAQTAPFTCRDDLDADAGDDTLADTSLPAPGAAFGYLVSAENPSAAEGTLGASAAGPRANTRSCILP